MGHFLAAPEGDLQGPLVGAHGPGARHPAPELEGAVVDRVASLELDGPRARLAERPLAAQLQRERLAVEGDQLHQEALAAAQLPSGHLEGVAALVKQDRNAPLLIEHELVVHGLHELGRGVQVGDGGAVQADLELHVRGDEELGELGLRRRHLAEVEGLLIGVLGRSILVDDDRPPRPLHVPPAALWRAPSHRGAVDPPRGDRRPVDAVGVDPRRVLALGANRPQAQVDAVIEDGPAVGPEDPGHVSLEDQGVERGDLLNARQVVEREGVLRELTLGDHLLVHVWAEEQAQGVVGPPSWSPRARLRVALTR